MPEIDTAPELQVLTELADAWNVRGHGPRLAAVRKGGAALRERLAGGPAVVSVRTFPVASLVYPARYAFWGAARSPLPYVTLFHRCVMVQFQQRGALKTLLFNPSDVEGARRAPFAQDLLRRYGFAEKFLSVTFEPLESQLAKHGLAPDDVDYLAFDHFHLQDLRRQLGTADGRLSPRFPRAQLLAPEVEWRDWDELHPMQKPFFVADGKQGVREDRVLFTREDLLLGDGVALVRTPGHTSGNQTLFFKTDRGVWGVSENGVCADSWSPRASRVPGIAAMAKSTELDVVLNANTMEYGADQYTSMMLEKTLVDPVPFADGFVQMFPSSEAQTALLSAGLSPTYEHRAVSHGEVRGSRAGAGSGAADKSRGFGALSNHY